MKNMKVIILVGIYSLSFVAQAEYRIYDPLETANNGRLPDGSIVFVGGNPPITPEEPEENDCVYDIGAGTAFVELIGYGETVQIKLHKNQRISNGTRGQAMFSVETATYYELCMNNQSPIPFVPEPEWENGACKYNSGLGYDATRYWVDTYAFEDQSVKLFMFGALGSYEGNGSISTGVPGVIFPSGWLSYPRGGIQMTNNNKIIYNGYQYYKGKLIDTREDESQDDSTIKRPLYFYEICRSKI
jgi:hypothetical protein